MSKREYSLIVVLAFIGGLIGGMVSNKLFLGTAAFAQNKEKTTIFQELIYAKTIVAKDYLLCPELSEDTVTFPVARLAADPFGNPRLVMQDNKRSPRLVISVDENSGAQLALLAKDGGFRATLTENTPYGTRPQGPGLNLFDKNARIRAQIGIKTDNKPFISLSDPIQTIKGELTFGRRIDLSLHGKDEVSIRLYDEEGQRRAVLGSDVIRSRETGLVTKYPPSSLLLYSDKEKVLWRAP